MTRSRVFRSTERLCEALARLDSCDVDYVSFDVFDTLIHRRAAPELVAHGVANYAAAQVGIASDAAQRLRDDAAREIHEEWNDEGLADDIHIDAWFARWAEKLDPSNASSLAASLVGEEIRLEKSVIYANPLLFGALTDLVDRGIGVFCVSDMYLGKRYVAELLSAAGYPDVFSDVFVSADWKATKRTGRLFDIVRGRERYRQARIVHVGDHPASDFRNPLRRRIPSFLIRDRAVERRRACMELDVARYRSDPSWSGVLMSDFTAPTRYEKLPPAEAIGRTSLGLLFSVFGHALAEAAVKKGLDRVYFLSREGLLLREVYELVGRPVYGDALPQGVYLGVARAPVLAATASAFGPRELLSIFPGGPVHRNEEGRGDLSSAFGRFLDIDTVVRVAHRYGFSGPSEPFDPWTDPRFHRLIEDGDIRARMESSSARARESLLEHLRERGFFECRRAGIVDVGWSGQIQEGLERVLAGCGDAPDLVGLYLATNANAARRRQAGSKLQGLIAEEGRGDFAGNSIFGFVDLFETVARAPHGTVLSHEANGTPVFATSDTPGRLYESECDALIASFQKGIRRTAELYGMAARMSGISSSAPAAYARLLSARLVHHPSRLEAETIGNLKHLTNHWSGETLGFAGPGRARPWDLLRPEARGTWKEGWALRAGGRLFVYVMHALQAWRDNKPGAFGKIAWDATRNLSLDMSPGAPRPRHVLPLEIEGEAASIKPAKAEPVEPEEAMNPLGLVRMNLSLTLWNVVRALRRRNPLAMAAPPLLLFSCRSYRFPRRVSRFARRYRRKRV